MRSVRFALLPVLALVASVVALWATASAPAEAAVRTLTTSYACTATTPVGTVHGTSKVTVRVELPAKVRRGHAVAARTITQRLTVPSNLLQSLRDFGVTSVSAKGTGARYRVGSDSYPIRHLVVPRTPVPASGPMVLRGSGTAAGFTPTRIGRYAVKVPRRLSALVTVHGGLADGQQVTMSCGLRSGAPATLSTLTVTR